MTDVPAGSRVSSGDARPELVVEAVNGLTVVTPARPRDGDVTAALTFRVGVADEPLAMRGICHLIEHLGLSNFQSDRLRWNGSVDLSRTTFLAEGPAAEVTRFLREVTSALGSLPESRIGHERRILQVEAQSRAGSIFESLLAMRYGLRGPGIVIAPEWGLEWLEGDQLRAWVSEWFTASNAALWSTAPLPADTLELSAGVPCYPTLPPRDLRLPLFEARDTPLVALSSVVPRALASSVVTAQIARRLWQRLRREHGLSYSPTASYSPLSADRAAVALSAETHAEHRHETVMQFLRTLSEMAEQGASDEELTATRQGMREQWQQPGAEAAHMDGVALGMLFGVADPLYERYEGDLERLTSDDLAAAARTIRDQALLIVPAGCENAADPPFRPYSIPTTSPVAGRRARWQYAPIGDVYGLTFGPDGVTHWNPDGRGTTVRFDACAGVIAWRNGARLLYAADGTMLDLRPGEWRGYAAVLDCVDAHAPQPMARLDRDLERDPEWISQAKRWRMARIWERWGSAIGAVASIGGVAVLVALLEMASTPSRRGPVLAFLVVAIVVGFASWIARKDMRAS